MFVVIYDDQMGMCFPYGWDDSCEGAIAISSEDVALFETRKQARDSINISTCFARLGQSQGKPFNHDFIDSRKLIRIVPATTKGGDK